MVGLDAVVLGLQDLDGLSEALGLAGIDLHAVLGQQKGILGIGDAAVLGGVQLIQQVVQRLPGLAGQQRKVAAGGILRLAQEVDRAAQAVKTLSEKTLGIIGVALGQDGAVGHTLAVRDEIAQISAAIHPDGVKRNNALQADAVGHRVGDGCLGLVAAVEDDDELNGQVDAEHRNEQHKQDAEYFFRHGALSFMLHAVCPSPLLLQNYFPRKSRTSAVALARTSSSSTYSQTASFWLRNQVSWRLA